MKNKKYYYVILYQVQKWLGYIEEGTIINEISEEKDGIPEVKSREFTKITKIIVEKITPFHVKEILTGCVFPIVNIELNYLCSKPIYYIPKQIHDAHTFIISKNDKIIGKDEISKSELTKYYQKHPNIIEFKEQLTTMIKNGENYKNQEKERKKVKTKK